MSYFGNPLYPGELVDPTKITLVTNSTALSSQDYGRTLRVRASSNIAITMMAATPESRTRTVTVVNESVSSTISVNSLGTDVLRVDGADATNFSLTPGDWAVLENAASGLWTVLLVAREPNATESVSGLVKISTTPLAQGLTDNTTALSPAKLATITATESRAGILRVATNAQAQALSGDTTLITPGKLTAAFQGANQNLAATGFQKLGGGFVMMWGTVAATTGGASVTFSPAFPIACRSLSLTVNSNAPTTASISASGLSATGFTAYSSSGTIQAWWQAVGH